jgi:GTP-binding protein YchF
LEIGIIGLPRSGKTTIFNALTGAHAGVSAFSSGKPEPHVGVLKIHDPRVDKLAEAFNPKRAVYATVKCIDIAGLSGASAEGVARHGLGEAQIALLSTVDVLLAVVRAFRDETRSDFDVFHEAESLYMELVLSDLARIEHRLPGLEKTIHKTGGQEKETLQHEQAALLKIKPLLEANRPVREAVLGEDEERLVRGFQFLTAKPLLLLLNIAEEDVAEKRDCTGEALRAAPFKATEALQMCAKLEMELGELEPEEKATFMKDYALEELSGEKIIRACLCLLDLVHFFTINPNELHVWAVRRGTTAVKAAGAVHSDFEHGFIRAEVIAWDKMIAEGGLANARKHGTIHTEGKSYAVQDGDVIHFLFSVS